MPNPNGSLIWFELITSEPAKASAFYEKVLGWKLGAPEGLTGTGSNDYQVANAKDGSAVAGLMSLPRPELSPTWFVYVGVNDVDGTVKAIRSAGGQVQMEPQDMPGVGRLAMVTDPQGLPFYVMKGASDESSTAFAPQVDGHADWTEIASPNPTAAFDFYSAMFGWTKSGSMPMGPGAEYVMLNVGEQMFGGLLRSSKEAPQGWRVYFRTTDIDDAVRRVTEGGGRVLSGPTQVPGGSYAIEAVDPQGAYFGLLGTKRA